LKKLQPFFLEYDPVLCTDFNQLFCSLLSFNKPLTSAILALRTMLHEKVRAIFKNLNASLLKAVPEYV